MLDSPNNNGATPTGIVANVGKPQTPGTVGQNLIRLMDEIGIKQAELVRRSGISRVTIWQIRKGEVREPDLATIEALAQGLGVPTSALTGSPEGTVEVEPILEQFLASDLAALLQPPLSDEEREYLLGLRNISWGGLPPLTPVGILHLINWRRSSGSSTSNP